VASKLVLVKPSANNKATLFKRIFSETGKDSPQPELKQ